MLYRTTGEEEVEEEEGEMERGINREEKSKREIGGE